MQPFSVLMSVYQKDKPEFLCQALNSIWEKQTLKPNEIVIVKDGALTSELDSVIEEFESEAPVKIVALQKNGGLGNALNVGLRYCSNELVARMDSDDISKPERFEKEISVFDEHPEYGVVGSWIDEFIESPNNVTSRRVLPEYPAEIYRYAKMRCPVNHPTVVYKKIEVEAVGGYKGFPEDLYLWVRMLMNGSKFYNIQDSLLWFRTSDDMFRRRGGWRYAKEELLVQTEFYRMGFLNFFEFVYSTIIRCGIRLLPNRLRIFVYKKILRK